MAGLDPATQTSLISDRKAGLAGQAHQWRMLGLARVAKRKVCFVLKLCLNLLSGIWRRLVTLSECCRWLDSDTVSRPRA